jgi:hypothetical protein
MLEEFINKCVDFKNCGSRCRLHCVHGCMKGRTQWIPESEWTCSMLQIKEVERA